MYPDAVRDPLRDKQQDPPTGYCARCGAELYRYDRGPLCPECERDESVDEKLKKIVDLARQLKEVVCDCPDVLSVYVDNPPAGCSDFTRAHVSVEVISKLHGAEFYQQRDGYRWFKTDEYGFRIIGAVKGGNQS